MIRPKIPFAKDYKQATIILSIGFVLLALLSWYLNVSHTVNLIAANKDYQERLIRSGHAEHATAKMEADLKALETSAVRSYDRDALMETVTKFCKERDMPVRNFPATEEYGEGGQRYYSQVIEVEGAFADITRLAHLLERKERLGSVASLRFHTVEDRVRKKTHLRGSIVLRNVGG